MLRSMIQGELIRSRLIHAGVKRRDIHVPHRRLPILGVLFGMLIALLAFGVAQFIAFNEGRNLIETSGWPSTVNFDLSTLAVAGLTAATTQGGGYGVLTGTGYTTKTQSLPTATGLGSFVFSAISWANGAATDWTSPKTIMARNNTASKLLCAWNINGGSAVDMSVANTTLNVTPTYLPTNPT